MKKCFFMKKCLIYCKIQQKYMFWLKHNTWWSKQKTCCKVTKRVWKAYLQKLRSALSKQIPSSYCTFAKCAACEKAYRNNFNDFTKTHENVCIALWAKPYCCAANLRNGLTFYNENWLTNRKQITILIIIER